MEDRERKTQELLKSTQNSDEIRQKMRKSGWQTEKRLQGRNEAMDQLQRYEAAFEQVRDATSDAPLQYRLLRCPSLPLLDIAEIEEVIEQIAEMEDENYTLFNYIQELDKDIESLNRKTTGMATFLEEASDQIPSGNASRHSSMDPVESAVPDEGIVKNQEESLEIQSTIIKRLKSLLTTLKGNSIDEITPETIGADRKSVV